VLEFGLGEVFNDCLREVHRSNMSKLCCDYEDAVETVNHYATQGTQAKITPVDYKFLVQRIPDLKTLKSVSYSPASFQGVFEFRNDYIFIKTDTYLSKDGVVKPAICIEGSYFALLDDVFVG